jgi:hypothetical protein
MKPILAGLVAVFLSPAVLAQQLPQTAPTPAIHPSDMSFGAAEQRLRDIQLNQNPADAAQAASLRSTLDQAHQMNAGAALTGGSTAASPVQPLGPGQPPLPTITMAPRGYDLTPSVNLLAPRH